MAVYRGFVLKGLDIMESTAPTQRMSVYIKFGIAGLVVTVCSAIAFILFGFILFPLVLIFFPLALASIITLLFGGVFVLFGLTRKENRKLSRVLQYLATLSAIIAMLCLVTIGPCNFIRLIDLRTRLVVALTGGQDELQSWAMQLLDKDRDRMDDSRRWDVPKEYWSQQVRRIYWIQPTGVSVDNFFENNQRGVRLIFGGGFFHWSIVIGPPGSVPDPKLNDFVLDSFWIRWRDGIYNWAQG